MRWTPCVNLGQWRNSPEREQLLLDISSLMDDFVSLQKTNQQANAAKQAGIEMSGEIVRRMAIDGPAKDQSRLQKSPMTMRATRNQTKIRPMNLAKVRANVRSAPAERSGNPRSARSWIS